MNELVIRNRVGGRVVDVGWLRKLIRHLLLELAAVPSYQLCVHLVGDRPMTRVNEAYLHHQGSTDVVTFNHLPAPSQSEIYGELFVCYEEARRQARRFRTHWTTEIVRYIVHGILHLQGFDDSTPKLRGEMKKRENRWVRALSRTFSLGDLQPRVGGEPGFQKPRKHRS
jgi:probable rRNA maturation factor